MLPALVLARVESGDVAAAASLAERLAQQPSITMPPEYMLTKLIRQFGRQRSRSLFKTRTRTQNSQPKQTRKQ